MGVYPGRHTHSTVSSTFSNMRSDRFCLLSHCFSCDPISRFNLRLVFKCFRHYINFGFGQLMHFASRILRYCRETDILHTTSGFVFFIFPSCHTFALSGLAASHSTLVVTDTPLMFDRKNIKMAFAAFDVTTGLSVFIDNSTGGY